MHKKDVFKKILLEYKSFSPHIIKRSQELPLNTGKIITVTGPRRSGKSFLMFQTIKSLKESGTPPENILYFNFEDERILPFDKNDFEMLMDAFYELYPDSVQKKVSIFFDEIQEIPFWEKFIRRLHEQKMHDLFLTGSSARLFSKEIATTLRGRSLPVTLFPFSFKEYLRYNNITDYDNIEFSQLRHKVYSFFEIYLKFGGFPEIFDLQEQLRLKVLQSYFELIFYRDIIERHTIRSTGFMRELMRYLLTNFSSLFSVSSYYNFLKSGGRHLGKDTLFEYLSILEEVQFVRLVPMYAFSQKQQMVNPKKIYIIDTGLVSAGSFQFSEKRGRYLENFVFLHLLRKYENIYYYKDQDRHEIDFLITDSGKPTHLVQVTAGISDPEIASREIPPLINAAGRFNLKDVFIITDNQRDTITDSGITIHIIPAWAWALKF